MDVLDLILNVAAIPSFSTYEERLYPLIERLVAQVEDIEVTRIFKNNLVIEVPGTLAGPPIALAAHLDKINHFGVDFPEKLTAFRENGHLVGLMDDAVGLGICLHFMLRSQSETYPPLLILLSEMEESANLRNSPELLRDRGVGLFPGIGAKRITKYLRKNDLIPSVVLNIDVTPKFRGKSGIAIYNRPWHSDNFTAKSKLVERTREVVNFLKHQHHPLLIADAYNDYRIYGKYFNRDHQYYIPCIAIEPAIYPYHQPNEQVFVKDIQKIVTMIDVFLKKFQFDKD